RHVEDARVRHDQEMVARGRSESPEQGRGRIGFDGGLDPHHGTSAAALIPASTLARLAAAEADILRGPVPGTANDTPPACARCLIRTTQRIRRSYCQFASVSGWALDWRMKGGIRIEV